MASSVESDLAVQFLYHIQRAPKSLPRDLIIGLISANSRYIQCGDSSATADLLKD